MPLEIVLIPCLQDNYAYLLHDAATGDTALIDAPEDAPIRAALDQRGWTLGQILITHHHDDHNYGVASLRQTWGSKVSGAAADAHRLPPLDVALRPGDSVRVGGNIGQVIDVPGHTIGHIAYYFPDSRAVFTADSLMTMGCGRLFEGTPDQMWATLSRLAALPSDTLVYSGHEYTATNTRFALTIDPANRALTDRAETVRALRAGGQPTVPTTLDNEKATNPFLRAVAPEVKAHLGMAQASDAEVFAEIRRRKDKF